MNAKNALFQIGVKSNNTTTYVVTDTRGEDHDYNYYLIGNLGVVDSAEQDQIVDYFHNLIINNNVRFVFPMPPVLLLGTALVFDGSACSFSCVMNEQNQATFVDMGLYPMAVIDADNTTDYGFMLRVAKPSD